MDLLDQVEVVVVVAVEKQVTLVLVLEQQTLDRVAVEQESQVTQVEMVEVDL
jgi:hypothetical protein